MVPEDERETAQQQHDLACPWAKKVAEQIEGLDESVLPELADDFPEALPGGVTDEYIRNLVSELEDPKSRYENMRQSYVEMKKRLEPNSFEQFFIVSAPYLVAVALALAVFKALYQV